MKTIQHNLSSLETHEVTLDQIQHSLETDKLPYQCRVCLDNTSSSKNKLLSLCKCKGSLKYVHKTCITQWIQKTLLKNPTFKSSPSINCELCKYPISYQLDTVNKCRSFDKTCNEINQKPLIFTFSFLGIFICLGLLIYSLYLLEGQIQKIKKSIFEQAIVVFSILTNTFLLAFSIYSFSKFFIQLKQKVKLAFKPSN